MNKYAVDSV